MSTSLTTSITIRDVPRETRDELASRAARSGRSLQEYLRGELIKLGDQPDIEELMRRVREQKDRLGLHLSVDEILAYRDADRR